MYVIFNSKFWKNPNASPKVTFWRLSNSIFELLTIFFVLNSILQLSKRYMDWNLYYWRIFGLCPFPPYSANHYLIMSLLWWWGCCCCCGIFKIVFPMIDRKFQKYHTVFTLKTFITLNACVTWVACIFIGILSHTFNCHGYA